MAKTDVFFHKLWPWGRLLDIIQILGSDLAKWLAIECVGEVCQIGQEVRSSLFTQVSSSDYKLVTLQQLMKKKESSKIPNQLENCQDENSSSSAAVIHIEGVPLLAKSSRRSTSSNFVCIETKRYLTKNACGAISQSKTVLLQV